MEFKNRQGSHPNRKILNIISQTPTQIVEDVYPFAIILTKGISEINLSMDKFNKLDEEREEITTTEDISNSEYKRILSTVRGKLVKSRTENKVLSEYINITKGFVQSIIDNALPQSRNKLYSRNGNIIQSQPQSVVVNTLF